MKIAWPETIEKMREMGYSEKEIEQMKKDPVDALCRFIDQGREISVFFKHMGIIIQLKGESAFRAAKTKEVKEGFFKDGWLKKAK